jgi:hypothetical protein
VRCKSGMYPEHMNISPLVNLADECGSHTFYTRPGRGPAWSLKLMPIGCKGRISRCFPGSWSPCFEPNTGSEGRESTDFPGAFRGPGVHILCWIRVAKGGWGQIFLMVSGVRGSVLGKFWGHCPSLQTGRELGMRGRMCWVVEAVWSRSWIAFESLSGRFRVIFRSCAW